MSGPDRIALIPSDGWSWTNWPIIDQEDAIEYIRADIHQSAIRAAREQALREAADRIGKLATHDPALALGTARAVAVLTAMIEPR